MPLFSVLMILLTIFSYLKVDPSTYSGWTLSQIDGSLLLEFGEKLSCDKAFSAWRRYWSSKNPIFPRLLVKGGGTPQIHLSYLCLNLPLFFHTILPPKTCTKFGRVFCGFILWISDGLIWNPLDPKGLGWCLCHAQPRNSSAAAEQVG